MWHRLLSLDPHDAEIDDVKGRSGGVEARRDRALEPARAEPRGGRVLAAAGNGEILDDPGPRVDANDLGADGGQPLACRLGAACAALLEGESKMNAPLNTLNASDARCRPAEPHRRGRRIAGD